jgi:hypothetical protein
MDFLTVAAESKPANELDTSQHTQPVELQATSLRTSPQIPHDFLQAEAGNESCLL